MEGGVEHSHHGNVAEHLAGGLDTQNTSGVVQGSQRAQLTQGVDDLIGDQAAALELLAAMHDAVTDGVDLAHVIDALACTGVIFFTTRKASVWVGKIAGVVALVPLAS